MTTRAASCDSLNRAEPRLGKCLLLGLGNDLLTDDAIGLRIARALKPLVAEHPDIIVEETTEMGLALLDLVVGFDRLVILDAIQTGRQPSGFLHHFQVKDLETLPTFSPHFLGIGEILALGQELGLAVPDELVIFAVEVSDPLTVSTNMTPQLEATLPSLTSRILANVTCDMW